MTKTRMNAQEKERLWKTRKQKIGKGRRRYDCLRSLNTLHWETAKEMITKKKLLNFRRLKGQKLHGDRSAYKKFKKRAEAAK